MRLESIYSFAITLTLLLFFILLSPVTAAETQAQRYAECDLCGYCQTQEEPPGNWRSCASCVYPGIPGTASATDKLTLEIQDEDPASEFYNKQVTPAPGKYFTAIGCIDTALGVGAEDGSFQTREGQGSVVNQLLIVINNIAGALAFVYLVYGAYTIMTAKGEPLRLAQGRSIIVSAIAGIIFLFTLGLILNLIANGILRIPGFGN